MEIIAIAAIGQNGELGRDNQLLWSIPEDMKFFKETTTGHTVIMGRKTFESIGRPLPNRNNLILTSNAKNEDNNEEKRLFFFSNIMDLLTFAKHDLNPEKLFVIGGGEVYKIMLGVCWKLYLTRVNASFEADTLFPIDQINEWFTLEKKQTYHNGEYDYSIETYDNVRRRELLHLYTNR
jgi:dihydrofolate reductase